MLDRGQQSHVVYDHKDIFRHCTDEEITTVTEIASTLMEPSFLDQCYYYFCDLSKNPMMDVKSVRQTAYRHSVDVCCLFHCLINLLREQVTSNIKTALLVVSTTTCSSFLAALLGCVALSSLLGSWSGLLKNHKNNNNIPENE